MKGGAMTASEAYSSVAESLGLMSKDANAVAEGLMTVASEELRRHGPFKFAGALNLKPEKNPATRKRKNLKVEIPALGDFLDKL